MDEGSRVDILKMYPEKKFCTKCRENKLRNEYYDHPGTADGKSSFCKACMITANNANRAKNKANGSYRNYNQIRDAKKEFFILNAF